MSLTVRTNVASLHAAANVSQTQRSLSRSFARLSSGLRIERAADDAAGLAIAEGLDAERRSATQARRNANDAISAIQVAEGSANEIADLLKRMREIAVQSGNGLMKDLSTERTYLVDEYDELLKELDRIAKTSEFSGTSLIQGGAAVSVQVGTGATAADQISISTTDLRLATLAASAGTNDFSDSTLLAAASDAKLLLTDLDSALRIVNSTRSSLGAAQNRLESAVNTLETYHTNVSAAESRIRDVDFAAETANMTRLNIMQQAGVAVLGQANALPNAVFGLIS